jgi:DNA-directed RNA polymerase specialized sigma24 family protein
VNVTFRNWTPQERDLAVVLRDDEGLGYEAIAERLGRDPKAVSVMIGRHRRVMARRAVEAERLTRKGARR